MSTSNDSSSAKPITLEEIRALVKQLPGPDLTSGTAAAERERTLTKPAGSLGRLEELAVWMSSWQGKHPPTLRRPRVAVFCGNHGVAQRGVSAYPPECTQQMVENFVNGGGAVNQLAQMMDADLRVYELDLDNPTKDFTAEAAMPDQECARAVAYGMMAVDENVDLLCLGEMGIGNTTSASALCLALYGGQAADWTGPGTGVAGRVLDMKQRVVAAGVNRHAGQTRDPLELLARLGGLELAAIIGAILAARIARTPVVLDGFATTAAAAVLHAIDPKALDHCVVGHLSAEPAHALLCRKIGKEPLLSLDMRLGEASGATLAAMIVKAAVSCHTGMATFKEARVAGPLPN